MDAIFSRAASAYQNQSRMLEKAAGAEVEEAQASPSFSEMLGNALSGAVDTQYKAETAQMNALAGKGDLTDLVTAVASAELTLNTVVAVRDRVISAYQDIMRMPI